MNTSQAVIATIAVGVGVYGGFKLYSYVKHRGPAIDEKVSDEVPPPTKAEEKAVEESEEDIVKRKQWEALLEHRRQLDAAREAPPMDAVARLRETPRMRTGLGDIRWSIRGDESERPIDASVLVGAGLSGGAPIAPVESESSRVARLFRETDTTSGRDVLGEYDIFGRRLH